MRYFRRGFTLMELLVVVVVIAILAALLMAVAGMVRRSAASVVCQKNLGQLGMALLGYAGDNRQAIPAPQMGGGNARDYPGGIEFNGNWYVMIKNYLPDFLWSTTFFCPASNWQPRDFRQGGQLFAMQQNGVGPFGNANQEELMVRWYNNSYGYNGCLSTDWGGPMPRYSTYGDHWWGWKLARVTNPSETVIIGDIWSVMAASDGSLIPVNTVELTSPDIFRPRSGDKRMPLTGATDGYGDWRDGWAQGVLRASHSNRTPFSFLDGHVKLVDAASLMNLTDRTKAPNSYAAIY